MNELNNLQLKTEEIVKAHMETTLKASQNILDEIKKSSINYGEAKSRLAQLKTATLFGNYAYEQRAIIESLFVTVERLLEREISDLPLTNRLSNT